MASGDIFGIHATALQLRSQRMAMLASNIANAATPHYKARDIDFSKALSLAERGQSTASAIAFRIPLLLVRARELTVAGASQSLAPPDRNAIATELSALAEELDSMAANRSTLSEPLFAGGEPRIMRFDGDVLFAPVPSRSALFDSGGQSAAQHVRDAAAAVSDGNAATIGNSLTALDGAIDQIATAQAQIGINAARLDRLAELHAERGVANKAERSALEDTDLTSAIAKLNAQTITLEAAQAAFARINRRTLFDILG